MHQRWRACAALAARSVFPTAGRGPLAALVLIASMLAAACSGGRDNSGYVSVTPTRTDEQAAAAHETMEAIRDAAELTALPLRRAAVSPPEIDGNGPGIPHIPGPLESQPSGIRYYDQRVGEGPTPGQGDIVIIHYTGWLPSGLQFDSTESRGGPTLFAIGDGRVIPGLDQGVSTMRLGGKRRLVVPHELAYGRNGSAPIPPFATLLFDVELISIRDPTTPTPEQGAEPVAPDESGNAAGQTNQ